MKKWLLTLLLNMLITLPALAADAYTVDQRHTFPSFEIDHMGFSTQRGRFNQTSGKITLDPKAANGGSLEINISTSSISTGLLELEEHLRGADFLDAVHFPQMTFVSDKLNFNKDQLVGVEGRLTLHGKTNPVHLTVDRFHCGLNLIALKNMCGANAVTTIKRSDFDVDKYVPIIADEVKIVIQIEATKN